MGQLLGDAVGRSATIIVVKAKTSLKKEDEKTMIPVALAVISFFQKVAYPHVFWMPWATDRNKMESAIRFLTDLKKQHNIAIICDPELVRYWSHLQKYGIVRRVGIMKNHHGPGKDATLFEGVREWAA